MLHLNFLILFFSISSNLFASTDFSKIEFKFLSATESSLFLSTPDEFTNTLTAIDLSLHHSTPETISIQEQLDFLKHVSLDWTPNEITLIKSEIELMENAVNSLDLKLKLPNIIKLIKTDGKDEFNSHYTRSNAIIFPIKNDLEGVTTEAPTLFHELFHLLSRNNPELTNQLYAICGFKEIPRVFIPASLHDISLTNPDAFYYQHSITVHTNGNQVEVIPFFYSALKQSEISGPIDEATTFKLGLLDLSTVSDPIPTMYKVSETDYKTQTKANSHYYIHPEEIMAENFRLLLMKAALINPMPPIKYPLVLDALTQILKNN